MRGEKNEKNEKNEKSDKAKAIQSKIKMLTDLEEAIRNNECKSIIDIEVEYAEFF